MSSTWCNSLIFQRKSALAQSLSPAMTTSYSTLQSSHWRQYVSQGLQNWNPHQTAIRDSRIRCCSRGTFTRIKRSEWRPARPVCHPPLSHDARRRTRIKTNHALAKTKVFSETSDPRIRLWHISVCELWNSDR